LAVPQLEYAFRKALLVAALSENAQILEPFAHTRGVPSITIAGDHKLMPVTSASMASYRASHCLRGGTDSSAVLFRSSCISHRLVDEITSIAHQMAEKDEFMIRPMTFGIGLGNATRDSQARSGNQVTNLKPSSRAKQAVFGSASDRPSAGETHPEHGLYTD
jgi:hypothetical protein